MKVYEKIVIDMSSGEILEEVSYQYSGPVSQCKGGGNQTVQQKSDPWSGVIPYLTGQAGTQATEGRWEETPGAGDPFMPGFRLPSRKWIPGTAGTPEIKGLLPEASKIFQEHTPTYFPGSTVAGFAPEQEQAMQLQSQRALAGSDVNRAAQDNITSTLRGDYLYGGDGFNSAFDAASRRIMPQVQSAFAGRRGGLAQIGMTQALGDAFAGLYGQERNNQLQAAGMAPSLAAQDYFDIGQLGQVGSQRQAMNQAQLDDQVARHQFQQELPYYRLGQFQNFINPILGAGGSSTTTQPLYRNRGAGALGGALAGSQLAPLLGIGGPAGIIGGAVLGGLL